MKLIFSGASFDIDDIDFINDLDSQGEPADIVVYANKSICDAIAGFSRLGYNYSEEFHCGLFARLDDFSVER